VEFTRRFPVQATGGYATGTLRAGSAARKAGTKSNAITLYRKRKTEALQGRKLPETLRRKIVAFSEIANDALAYSRKNKLSYRDDEWRMELLLTWFREYPAEGITAQDIEAVLGSKSGLPQR
jgi:hypothetical protein